jgi:hypothetical protein
MIAMGSMHANSGESRSPADVGALAPFDGLLGVCSQIARQIRASVGLGDRPEHAATASAQ